MIVYILRTCIIIRANTPLFIYWIIFLYLVLDAKWVKFVLYVKYYIILCNFPKLLFKFYTKLMKHTLEKFADDGLATVSLPFS